MRLTRDKIAFNALPRKEGGMVLDKKMQTCPECGELFKARRPWHVFCNEKHRNAFHAKLRKSALEEYRATHPSQQDSSAPDSPTPRVRSPKTDGTN
jgi:uncharacterized C2H2 Zn-finger protein